MAETIREDDILFDCPICGKNLVIEGIGRGLKILCPQCQSKIEVPNPKETPPEENKTGASPPPPPGAGKPPEKAGAAPGKELSEEKARPFDPAKFEGWDTAKLQDRFKELKNLLKENTSQRTETIEYISHANLRLQRETIKLRKLEARKAEFEQELEFLARKLNINP